MALVNPCNLTIAAKNTGVECGSALKASALFIMMPKNSTWGDDEMEDFTEYVKTQIHAAGASRWYPIFGTAQPIRQITEANESDVIETLEDGSVVFIRYGMYNRTFFATDGGYCLAQALMGIPGGLSFIELDITGQVAVQKSVDADGNNVYSGFPTNLAYGPAPTLANLKTSYKNALMLSFSPNTYIKKGKIFASSDDEDLLSLQGLIDVEITKNSATTTSGATAATGSVTITAVGADGNTIDILVNGSSISGGPVTKTASESTVTLLAAKIAAAITAATATNGGYTATNTVGAVNITAPLGLGASINAVAPTVAIVGSITNSAPVAFSGGVTGTAVLKVDIKTECAETDLIAVYGTTLVAAARFVVKNAAGTTITISGASIVSGHAEISIPYLSGTYTVDLVEPAALKAAGIEGYDATNPLRIVVS